MNLATLFDLGQGLIYGILCIAFVLLAKRIDDWRTKDFNDDVHIDDGNIAIGLRKSGLYLGIAIALSGALDGPSRNFFIDFIQLLIDGLIITGFMFTSRFVNDFIMLGHIDNDKECVKTFTLPSGEKKVGNSAVGMVEASMYVATGLILKGSIAGTGGTFIQSLLNSVLFFVIGQIVLLGFGLLYELITPFNVKNEIKDNNLAAGIGLGGILIALGIILMGSISGPFTGWLNDLASFGIYTVFGIIMLLAFRAVTDRFLLPSTNIAVEIKDDRNISAVIVIESVINAVAIIIAFSI